MQPRTQTVEEITELLKRADEAQFEAIERSLAADSRKTVQQALASARARLESARREQQRVHSLYARQRELASGALCVGLDEVGRGPLAGPLTVGAVVLPDQPELAGLNDSKKVVEGKREDLARRIRSCAQAVSVVHIRPSDIDEHGMTWSLKTAFARAIAEIDAQVAGVECVLIDGNPLRVDARETSVVKGDATCASIAAASLVAKVERDALMRNFDGQYPGYGFADNKGYASAQHQDAIRELGLSPIHRATFCHALVQPTLF